MPPAGTIPTEIQNVFMKHYAPNWNDTEKQDVFVKHYAPCWLDGGLLMSQKVIFQLYSDWYTVNSLIFVGHQFSWFYK